MTEKANENKIMTFDEEKQGERLNYRRKKRRLDGEIEELGRITQILVEKIIPNQSQPRLNFETNAILRLADSIRRYGILQPLTVRRRTDVLSDGKETTEHDEKFELVAGERRFRAARMLGFSAVPCIIIKADTQKSAELSLIENLLRENLNMFETANAISKLTREFCLTQEEVAKKLSMSQSAVANKLRLLKLGEEEQSEILKNGLTERHARALLKIENAADRITVINHIVAYKLNVGATEIYIDRLLEEQYFEMVGGTDANIDKEDGNKEKIGRKKPIIKDIRLFFNSVEHAVDIVKASGIDITSNRRETDDGIIIEINIPNPRNVSRETLARA